MSQPKMSRKARSDQQWNLIKQIFYDFYITQDKSLPETRAIIAQEHGFTRCERTWKLKLEDWGFEKNVPAKIMKFMTAKAEKRKREHNKNSRFEYRGINITQERLDNFRRKITKTDVIVNAEVATPEHITCYTPMADVTSTSQNETMQSSAREATTCHDSPALQLLESLRVFYNSLAPSNATNATSPHPDSPEAEACLSYMQILFKGTNDIESSIVFKLLYHLLALMDDLPKPTGAITRNALDEDSARLHTRLLALVQQWDDFNEGRHSATTHENIFDSCIDDQIILDDTTSDHVPEAVKFFRLCRDDPVDLSVTELFTKRTSDTDRSSNKYGVTYSASEITGISHSEFLKP